jgi:hypothetical protein
MKEMDFFRITLWKTASAFRDANEEDVCVQGCLSGEKHR